MKHPKKILDAYGRPYRDSAQQFELPHRLMSRYDSAQTTNENLRHWANADSLSAAAANSPDVRAKLRSRSRYERANNGYYCGLVNTLADDTIGTGPSLQGQEDSDAINRAVEERWWEWCERVGFIDLLHLADKAKTTDGEAIVLRSFDPTRNEDDVQLDLAMVETEQLSGMGTFGPRGSTMEWMLDGIAVDSRGRPSSYRILKEHPGDATFGALAGEATIYPAGEVVHWFRQDRPGQFRGVPELLASLPLCAMLRRWTLAALLASEIAASFAAVMETDGASSEEEVPTPFQALEIVRGMMTALPAGSKMHQFKPEQPHNLYQEFKRELLKEIGRPVSAPFNVVSGDSSPYNYSSARLDHLLYRGGIMVKREHCRRRLMERVFGWWWEEAVRVPGYFGFAAPANFRHCWRWPGFATIDPLKEALADTERLSNATATLSELLAEENKDWEEQLEQRQREIDRLASAGQPLPKWAAGASTPPSGDAAGKPVDKQGGGGNQGDGEQEDPQSVIRRDLLKTMLNGSLT